MTFCLDSTIIRPEDNAQIENDQGFFSIENIVVNSNYVLFSGIGYYFNEITGGLSASTLSLQTLSNIENRNSLNINVLTHLERKRVEYLHTENGLSFGEAKTQAINEIFDILKNKIKKNISRKFVLLEVTDWKNQCIIRIPYFIPLHSI